MVGICLREVGLLPRSLHVAPRRRLGRGRSGLRVTAAVAEVLAPMIVGVIVPISVRDPVPVLPHDIVQQLLALLLLRLMVILQLVVGVACLVVGLWGDHRGSGS